MASVTVTLSRDNATAPLDGRDLIAIPVSYRRRVTCQPQSLACDRALKSLLAEICTSFERYFRDNTDCCKILLTIFFSGPGRAIGPVCVYVCRTRTFELNDL